jgi:hypothetical protein
MTGIGAVARSRSSGDTPHSWPPAWIVSFQDDRLFDTLALVCAASDSMEEIENDVAEDLVYDIRRSVARYVTVRINCGMELIYLLQASRAS